MNWLSRTKPVFGKVGVQCVLCWNDKGGRESTKFGNQESPITIVSSHGRLIACSVEVYHNDSAQPLWLRGIYEMRYVHLPKCIQKK